jgi:hypothetical protein
MKVFPNRSYFPGSKLTLTMPHIEDVQPLSQHYSPKPLQPYSAFAESPSPNGRWALVFTEPNELRMGLPFWQKTQLILDGEDVSEDFGFNDILGYGSQTVRSSSNWSATGEKFSISYLTSSEQHPITSAVAIFDLVQGAVTYSEFDIWPLAMEWSTIGDALLLVSVDRCRVVKGSGFTDSPLGSGIGNRSALLAGWTLTSEYYFCTGPGLTDSGTELTFYRSSDDQRVERIKLDSDQMVPYDKERFSVLDRHQYCLVIDGGTRAVGRLLDDWSDFRFDPVTGRAFLGVYRPISDVSELPDLKGELESKILGCEVARQWTSLRIVD